jgi:hypothetical protein
VVLLWTATNPTCRLGREHLPCTSSTPWLRLAFLATMRPALDPTGHGVPQAEPTCLLHSSEALQSIDISRLFFTCTNANEAATCTCNTRPRDSPHHVVNRSSQPEATLHRSSTAIKSFVILHIQVSLRESKV